MSLFSSSSGSSSSGSGGGGGGGSGLSHTKEELIEVVDGWGVRKVSQEQFNASAERVKAMEGLPNEQKLELYGLFKQSVVGDINSKRPWAIDMVNAAKWDAWKKYEGLTQDYAMLCYVYYIDFVVTDVGKSNSYLGTSVSIMVPAEQEEWAESEEIFSLVNDNDVAAVEAYIKKYPMAARLKGADNLTPLHYAADRGFVKIVAVLIASGGADVNAKDESGNTPVMTAAICGSLESIKMLIDNNADVMLENSDGENCINSSMIDKNVKDYIQGYKK